MIDLAFVPEDNEPDLLSGATQMDTEVIKHLRDPESPIKLERGRRIRSHLERFQISARNDLQEGQLQVQTNGLPDESPPRDRALWGGGRAIGYLKEVRSGE